jgi:hypothetical protein
MNFMSYQPAPQDKDPQLWHLAHRRASFKYHLGIYIVMNSFFWVVWYFTSEATTRNGWPWPVWPTIGWGIGLLFHYLGAYVYPKSNAIEKEYEKLKQKSE